MSERVPIISLRPREKILLVRCNEPLLPSSPVHLLHVPPAERVLWWDANLPNIETPSHRLSTIESQSLWVHNPPTVGWGSTSCYGAHCWADDPDSAHNEI
ncbi:hypothetical protein BHM03_00046722 [Ensete ventricosum]|nr:hypothetical protein BHM03_00046722 [Ensete ventricosum]